MTKDERKDKLINRIEADLKRLEALTGYKHISTFVINNNFHLYAFDEYGKPTIDIFRKEKNNE